MTTLLVLSRDNCYTQVARLPSARKKAEAR
jgi:hypothetical protein